MRHTANSFLGQEHLRFLWHNIKKQTKIGIQSLQKHMPIQNLQYVLSISKYINIANNDYDSVTSYQNTKEHTWLDVVSGNSTFSDPPASNTGSCWLRLPNVKETACFLSMNFFFFPGYNFTTTADKTMLAIWQFYLQYFTRKASHFIIYFWAHASARCEVTSLHIFTSHGLYSGASCAISHWLRHWSNARG